MDISKIKRNSAAIAAGVWRDNVDGEGLRLYVRGFTSPEFQDAYTERLRAVPRAQRDDKGEVIALVQNRIHRETIADVGLLDWGGLTDAGTAVPYSKALARQFMTNRDYAELYEIVVGEMQSVDKTRAAIETDVTGN